MKRFSDMRADRRSIEDKASGLIYAMDDAAAERLFERLKWQAEKESARAKMFLGRRPLK